MFANVELNFFIDHVLFLNSRFQALRVNMCVVVEPFSHGGFSIFPGCSVTKVTITKMMDYSWQVNKPSHHHCVLLL